MAQKRTNILTGPDFTHLPSGLDVGSQVLVRGRMPEGLDRFSINLQMDKGGKDVAFHFNPRVGQNTVVRNTKHNNGWQNEERDIPHFPFKNGAKFTVRIWTGPEEFVVLVNGRNFITYKHRLPFKDVRYLRLGEGPEYYEASYHSAFNAPYKGEFVSGLKVGKSVRVRGMTNDDAERFAINFLTGDGKVAFHFNPRQNVKDCVLNSKIGAWGQEERGQSCFPFERGQFFDVHFIILAESFKVFVNDKHFTDYKFRVPVEDITHLDIHEDVTLMEVEFNDPMPDSYVKEIPSGVEEGDLVVTRGYFFEGGNRFSVNLINGNTFDDDINFHFNPRRDQGAVVLNTRLGGWQTEERHPLPDSMKDMVPFQVEIVVKSDEYDVFINGTKLASYKARDDISKIKGIGVKGDVYIHEAKLLKRLEQPFADRFPAPMNPGCWVSVMGTPNSTTRGGRFDINLQCGEETDKKSCDIAFHFNPRFRGEVTVRNTLKNAVWGKEEREQPDFPFKVNDRFQVDILRMDDVFRVFVNQNFYVNYAHRLAAESVCHCLLVGNCDFFEPEFFY